MVDRFFNLRMADRIRFVIWTVAVLFFITGLVFAYIGILTQDGDVMGGLAALNLTVGAVLSLGNCLSYI